MQSTLDADCTLFGQHSLSTDIILLFLSIFLLLHYLNMSEVATSTLAQPDIDPRSKDEYRTKLVGSGSQKDVLAHIFYSKASEEKGKPVQEDLPFLKPDFTDDRTVVIHDARGLNMTIDENGFEYITHPKPEADFSSEESVRKDYYPAMMKMIKEK